MPHDSIALTGSQTRRPLLLGTSGGAGCIISIGAVAEMLKTQGVTDFPMHTPRLLDDKVTDWNQVSLLTASWIMNEVPLISAGVSAATTLSNYPILPLRSKLKAEMKALSQSQTEQNGAPKQRPYVDMMLDVCQSGYIYTAIYNILQKTFNIEQNKTLVDNQLSFEKQQFKTVKQFFIKKLNDALKAGTPYTELYTTQMVSIDAICAAVIEYNKANNSSVVVHQYMSDIFTEGAQHYVKPLSLLNKKSRAVLHLHGMNLLESTHLLTNIETAPFASLENVPFKSNPMVRKEFHDQERLSSFKSECLMPIQSKDPIHIAADEKIASVMLGSLAGDDSFDYAESLSKMYDEGVRVYAKIFVFCGNNETLKERLKKAQRQAAGRAAYLGLSLPSDIIILDNQDATHVSNLLMRSDLSVLRGGVVLMEEMSLDHHAHQQFFFHQVQNTKGKYTTGLPWEDAGIQYFIKHVTDTYHISSAEVGSIDAFHKKHTNAAGSTDYLLEELNRYTSAKDVQGQADFRRSIHALLDMVAKDMNTQKSKKHSDKQIKTSAAYRIANETLQFVSELTHLVSADASKENKDKISALIKSYDESCYKIAHRSKFAKAVVGVLVAAVGFALGMIIGGSIGIIAGLWTGPGAVASGLAGLFTGAFSGANLRLSLFSLSAGATSGLVTGFTHSFFKPTPLEQATHHLAHEASTLSSQVGGG